MRNRWETEEGKDNGTGRGTGVLPLTTALVFDVWWAEALGRKFPDFSSNSTCVIMDRFLIVMFRTSQVISSEILTPEQPVAVCPALRVHRL